jgi:hypothetical protein
MILSNQKSRFLLPEAAFSLVDQRIELSNLIHRDLMNLTVYLGNPVLQD